MSKIQKALGRIQAARSSAASRENGAPALDDSIVVARLREQALDPDSAEQNGQKLHFDHEALRNAGLIAPKYHEHVLANQYRDIKRPLIANAFGKRTMRVEDGNLIMVTSALPGEGKTFTSINLALSMAQERDHEVLLVDADVAKPRTSEMFDATEEMGLLDLLENPELPVRQLILPTDIDGLSILPAGKPRHHATELFASEVMQQLLRTLAGLSKGQIVIFDSPPLLLTSEAKVLASCVGQVVVVVRAEETSQDAVNTALEILGQDRAVNLVLNQVRAGFGQYQYGYGYGYSFEGTEPEEKEDE